MPEPSVRRVRHEVKLRDVEVTRVSRPAAEIVCVTLAGEALQGFVSASFDDHVKVFFPPPGAPRPAMPVLGPNGPEYPADQPRPAARDFTPRRFDATAGTLDLEIVLHAEGPAAAWAREAAVGQRLGVGGPRGSFIIDDTFDWYLLIGDASAVPSIGRRLEELPRERPVTVLLTAGPAYRPPLAREVQWIEEDALLSTVRALPLPPGVGHVWAAGESSVMKALRDVLVRERGLDKRWVRVSGYWKRGAAAVHETLDD